MSFEDEDTYCDDSTQENTQLEESQALLGEVVKETQEQHDDVTNDFYSDEVEGTPQSCLHHEITDSMKTNRRRRKTQKELFQKNKRKQSRKISEKICYQLKDLVNMNLSMKDTEKLFMCQLTLTNIVPILIQRL